MNTVLTSLNCGSNQLTNLDVSKNTALTSLNCGSNQLTNLDVSTNTALTSLNCGSNQLMSLNVSTNTGLMQLECESNPLKTLDVSQCAYIVEILITETRVDKGTYWGYKDLGVEYGKERGVYYVSFDKKVRVDLGGGSYIEPEKVTPTEVVLNKTEANVIAGKTLTQEVTLTPSDAETILTWKSSNTKVATVSEEGIVTAVAEGSATITVITENGLKAICKVTVNLPAAKKVVLSKKGTKS